MGSLLDLLIEGHQQKGAELAFLPCRRLQVIPPQELRKEALRQVLRVVRPTALPPQIRVSIRLAR